MILTQILSANYRVTFPGLCIEDGLEISRVAFRLGSIEIYWYGLLIASAVLLAMFMSVRHAPKFNLKPDDVLDYFLWTIPAGIVSARSLRHEYDFTLGHVLQRHEKLSGRFE